MKKIVISGMIGNSLEWYDYALYAQFAPIIARHFFPDSDIREILTFAVFAAGFIVRPVGGIVFGIIGDQFGRKAALVIGILTMCIPTVCIGLLPGYQSIGIAAPIILTLLRLIQGFSLGGEFSGCISYIVEHAGSGKNRGIAGTTSFISMCIGMLIGLITSSCFSYFMSPENLESWGWRIPFIAGIVVGGIGLYIRSHLAESPIYKMAKEKGELSKSPVKDVLVGYWLQLLMGIAIYVTVTAPFYTSTVFIESFMKSLGYSDTQSSLTSGIILVVMMVVLPISAVISDRVGRRSVIIIGACAIILTCYPAFRLLGSMNFTMALASQIVFAAAISFYMGPVPTILVELFPTKVRFTGVALSYNISAALFGGTAPMIGASLVRFTGDKYALSYYLIALGVISLTLILKFYKETYKRDLR